MDSSTKLCKMECINRIDQSLCNNLKDFCDIKLVFRSCCEFCKKTCPTCKDWTLVDDDEEDGMN